MWEGGIVTFNVLLFTITPRWFWIETKKELA